MLLSDVPTALLEFIADKLPPAAAARLAIAEARWAVHLQELMLNGTYWTRKFPAMGNVTGMRRLTSAVMLRVHAHEFVTFVEALPVHAVLAMGETGLAAAAARMLKRREWAEFDDGSQLLTRLRRRIHDARASRPYALQASALPDPLAASMGIAVAASELATFLWPFLSASWFHGELNMVYHESVDLPYEHAHHAIFTLSFIQLIRRSKDGIDETDTSTWRDGMWRIQRMQLPMSETVALAIAIVETVETPSAGFNMLVQPLKEEGWTVATLNARMALEFFIEAWPYDNGGRYEGEEDQCDPEDLTALFNLQARALQQWATTLSTERGEMLKEPGRTKSVTLLQRLARTHAFRRFPRYAGQRRLVLDDAEHESQIPPMIDHLVIQRVLVAVDTLYLLELNDASYSNFSGNFLLTIAFLRAWAAATGFPDAWFEPERNALYDGLRGKADSPRSASFIELLQPLLVSWSLRSLARHFEKDPSLLTATPARDHPLAAAVELVTRSGVFL